MCVYIYIYIYIPTKGEGDAEVGLREAVDVHHFPPRVISKITNNTTHYLR